MAPPGTLDLNGCDNERWSVSVSAYDFIVRHVAMLRGAISIVLQTFLFPPLSLLVINKYDEDYNIMQQTNSRCRVYRVSQVTLAKLFKTKVHITRIKLTGLG